MVGVVGFARDVCRGQRDRSGLRAGDVAVGRKPVPFADETADVRALRDDLVSRHQERRRKRRKSGVLSAQERKNGGGTTAFVLGQARNVHVGDACGFEHETRKLTASLDERPIVELVRAGHWMLLSSSRDCTSGSLPAIHRSTDGAGSYVIPITPGGRLCSAASPGGNSL